MHSSQLETKFRSQAGAENTYLGDIWEDTQGPENTEGDDQFVRSGLNPDSASSNDPVLLPHCVMGHKAQSLMPSLPFPGPECGLALGAPPTSAVQGRFSAGSSRPKKRDQLLHLLEP